jgi:hypothetical protein
LETIHVMNAVVKTMNFTIVSALNHCEFYSITGGNRK